MGVNILASSKRRTCIFYVQIRASCWKKVASNLVDKIALVMERWSASSTHYLVVFLLFHLLTKLIFKCTSDVFAVQNETTLEASIHTNTIKDLFQVFSLRSVLKLYTPSLISVRRFLCFYRLRASHRYNLVRK